MFLFHLIQWNLKNPAHLSASVFTMKDFPPFFSKIESESKTNMAIPFDGMDPVDSTTIIFERKCPNTIKLGKSHHYLHLLDTLELWWNSIHRGSCNE